MRYAERAILYETYLVLFSTVSTNTLAVVYYRFNVMVAKVLNSSHRMEQSCFVLVLSSIRVFSWFENIQFEFLLRTSHRVIVFCGMRGTSIVVPFEIPENIIPLEATN